MKEKLNLNNTRDRRQICQLLREGKVGLFPTDTIYGICCRMDSKLCVERVFDIKKREKKKPFLILASSINQVREYADLSSKKSIKLVDRYWPGPLTVVLKAKEDKVLSQVRSGGATVALRIPDYPELTEIISEINIPLIAPSANLSGEDAPKEYTQVNKDIVDAVDFVVLGECKMKKPSTIVDCSRDDIEILREGAIDVDV